MKHIKKRPYLIPLLGLVLGFCIVAAIWVSRSSATFRPSDSRVVYLFDGEQRQVLGTRASTVGELISRLNLQLIEQDVVEPSSDTEIVEDNFRINVYRARPVTVVDGQTRTVTLTAQRSSRVVAQQAGLKMSAEDLATFQRGSLNENVIGEQVIVSRATPITLNLYGTQVATYTQAKTINELLIEKKIRLDHGESVNPGRETPITANMQVFVLSQGSQVVTVEEAIPIPIQEVSDVSLSFGTTATRQEGTAGKKLVTYLVAIKDKQETRQVIQEAIIHPPVPKIIAKGTTININRDKTALMSAAGIASSDHGYVNYIVSRESSWRPDAQGLPRGSPSSGAYGLCQAYPGSKMVSAGGDWLTNPVTQLKWCHGYAKSRYGSWAAAYNYWAANKHW